MVLSGCIPLLRTSIIHASFSNNSSNPKTPRKPSKIPSQKRSQPKQNQPSLAEIEQAIGAGKFRDYDPASETGENQGVFDIVLKNSIGRTEGPTERALRETGEWMGGQTEKAARSWGRRILEVMFFWIAPAWFLLFLVANGTVKLPFSSPALDNLIM